MGDDTCTRASVKKFRDRCFNSMSVFHHWHVFDGFDIFDQSIITKLWAVLSFIWSGFLKESSEPHLNQTSSNESSFSSRSIWFSVFPTFPKKKKKEIKIGQEVSFKDAGCDPLPKKILWWKHVNRSVKTSVPSCRLFDFDLRTWVRSGSKSGSDWTEVFRTTTSVCSLCPRHQHSKVNFTHL